jgi:hypothetical protein
MLDADQNIVLTRKIQFVGWKIALITTFLRLLCPNVEGFLLF